jgi:uncharacterized protein YjbI with pentapeptide repeats
MVAKFAQRRRRRRWVRAVGLLAVVAVVVVFALAIWAAAWLLPPMLVQHQLATRSTVTETDRLREIDAVRTSLLGPLATLIAATAVLTGAVVAYLNFRGTLELNRRGQVTERFSKAIDQLGARGEEEFEKLDIRLGAIYALEQIARDSPELHWPIVEILTAFIRVHTKAAASTKGPDPSEIAHGGGAPPSVSGRKVATDIQAALTVLGRRHADRDQGQVDLSEANLQGAYLMEANLQGAYFGGANLQGTRLVGANLQGAYLGGANLQGGRLGRANLRGADLGRANLQGAGLTGANLQGARLGGANLQGARLGGANLQDADLGRANLQEAGLGGANLQGAYLYEANLQDGRLGRANLQDAVGLTQDQLDSAKCDSETKPPSGLTVHVEQPG